MSDYFGEQLFITTSGHFSTPALMCAIGQVGSRSIMFSIDYPSRAFRTPVVRYHGLPPWNTTLLSISNELVQHGGMSMFP